MMNLKKLSKNSLLVPFLISLIFLSCSKEEKNEKNIAKVNDAVLTEDMLNSMMNDSKNKAKLKDEIINQWIEDEVLFQEAEKEGITNEKEFQKILERSKKNLAISFLIKKYLDKNEIQIKDEELKKYYDENKNEFVLNDELYYLRIARFENYESAIEFRKKLIETNWNIANNYIKTKTDKFQTKEDLIYKKDLQPIQVVRIVNTMEINEISSIIDISSNEFIIINLMNKYSENTIPPFEAVKNLVKEKLTILKQKELIHNYLTELLSEHNLEIERFSE
ncbi:MAG: peptidyl-prolyl cis-trans isomerase [Ignavibacteriales bacterium]|nr:peptidyl-prolyl cis-trans isomerase [Ignavibacteriales bacterium]